MAETILVYIVGLIGGISVGVQSTIVGAMNTRVGGAAGSLIVHASGALFSVLLLLARGGENLRDWRQLPWYMLGSGAFGVLLYLTLNVTFPRLGAGAAVTLIIVGQLLSTIVIDHFGLLGAPLRPVDATRLLAVGLLLVGSYLVVR